MRLYEDYKEFECGKNKQALAFIPRDKWTVVNYAEDGIFVYIFSTKQKAEEFLLAIHTEGSHTDNDTYEIYYLGKEFDYELKIVIM